MVARSDDNGHSPGLAPDLPSPPGYRRRRNLVVRGDGKPVNVARFRGQLLVCATGCCCGRTEDGFPCVPADLYHAEWERRRLRNLVHLTIGGCLGPCALANVVLLLFDGQALWFHGIDSKALVLALYDHIERLLESGPPLPPPPDELARRQFTASAWQPRPDGQPVDDLRPRRRGSRAAVGSRCHGSGAPEDGPAPTAAYIATMPGAEALPRRNGELVFAAPWQGRALGMAVALHEQGLFTWEEFRQALIAEIAAAEARPGLEYYEAWLAALERVLAAHGVVRAAEIEEGAFEFEFGERDEVF